MSVFFFWSKTLTRLFVTFLTYVEKNKMVQEVTRLSGSVAEGLSHGDVAHSWRTAWLSVI